MFYLIVWCEESKQWWQADECEAARRCAALGRCSAVAIRGWCWAE